MATDMKALLQETARTLEQRLSEKHRALIGFDGFVDEIIRGRARSRSPGGHSDAASRFDNSVVNRCGSGSSLPSANSAMP